MKPPFAEWGRDIMEKAFTWTLCFNDSRISQVQNSVKSKATVDAPWMCYIRILRFIVWTAIGVLATILVNIWYVKVLYIHTFDVGFSRCSFQQSWAMREPLNRGTSSR